MLIPDKVKPFLCDEDTITREHAIDYLANSFNRDPDIMPLVIESCQKFGEIESSMLLSRASIFTQSETGLHTILKWLEKSTSFKAIISYNSIISQADLNLLEPLLPVLGKYKNVSEKTMGAVNKRLSFAGCSTMVLWDELFDYCNEIKHKSFELVDDSHGLYLVEALAKRDDLPVDELLEYLGDNENFFRYDSMYMIILAGELQLEEAIPALFEKLRLDADLICDVAGDALIKIGTDSVIRQLQEVFLSEDDSFRLFGTRIFGNVKVPLAESALLEILPEEKDANIKTFLANEVCNLVSEKGIPAVKLLIDQDAYNSSIMDLRRPLYASCRMLQVNLEESEQWKKDFHDHDRALEERIKAMDMFFPSLTAVDGGQIQEKESRKIGRNEPCPCGSSKKHKKCCGRS